MNENSQLKQTYPMHAQWILLDIDEWMSVRGERLSCQENLPSSQETAAYFNMIWRLGQLSDPEFERLILVVGDFLRVAVGDWSCHSCYETRYVYWNEAVQPHGRKPGKFSDLKTTYDALWTKLLESRSGNIALPRNEVLQ